ncbi:MAG: hypothetical protein HY402_05065 [Elusimicrobia bacterium]|nr:hypothetical protein [Elusimicrobiota bacterium]
MLCGWLLGAAFLLWVFGGLLLFWKRWWALRALGDSSLVSFFDLEKHLEILRSILPELIEDFPRYRFSQKIFLFGLVSFVGAFLVCSLFPG